DDDARHRPGPAARPLWNESFWFPFYVPTTGIAVVFRIGLLPVRGEANVFCFLAEHGTVVHSFIDHRLPVPAYENGRLSAGGLTIDWSEPLERFRLRYAAGRHGFDVAWEATSPTYLYPRPPDTHIDDYPGHIEQGGRVRGTVTLAGVEHRIDCLGHRDHSFGGERDWSHFHRWNYLSGELGTDFWFNAVRIDIGPETD